jgi:hypothetical protein
MKKMIMMLSLISLNAFAYNTEYSKLAPGKKIFVDVQNKDVISLTLDTKSANTRAQPKVEVVAQWGNFECEYKQTLLSFAGFDMATGNFKRTWEIQMNWMPGADLSGCIVNVTFPGMEDSQAELFMNY